MNICIYCGSQNGAHTVFAEMAVRVADEIVRRGWGLVYGGGNVGIMGIIARRIHEQNGYIHGVIPEFLATEEIAFFGCSELSIVRTMHERKQHMIDQSAMLLALPGGYGTMDELFEAITWKQLQLHDRPIGVLNVNGYFDPLVEMVDHFIANGFVREQHRELFTVSSDVTGLLDHLAENAGNPLFDRTERG